MPLFKKSAPYGTIEYHEQENLKTKYTLMVWGGIIACAVGYGVMTGENPLTDVEGTTKALKANNFDPVDVGGYSLYGCGSDLFATKFVAKNQQGKRVNGVGCSGLIKGTTLRFTD